VAEVPFQEPLDQLRIRNLAVSPVPGRWYDWLSMVSIQIQLDEGTVGRLRSLAEARHCSIEDLLRDLLTGGCEPAGTSTVPLLGMFADAPALIDEIVEAAMKDRAEQPLRRSLA